jgi:outer membrane protein OmpA-like peptidoglycan-associated protein
VTRSIQTLVLFGLAGAAASAWAEEARAQATAPGFALNRFEPSETGSEWFTNDTLDLRGMVRPALGVVGDYGYKPYVLKNPDGSENSSIVTDQFFLHIGGSLVLFNRLRIGVSLPVALSQEGSTTGGLVNGQRVVDKLGAGVGDFRAGLDLRLVGEYGDPFTLALGGRVWAPTGSTQDYLGEGKARIGPHLSAAGDVGVFVYAGSIGVVYRGNDPTFAGHPQGTEADLSLAAGVRVLDRNLVIGPEVALTTVISDSGAILKDHTTPLALLGSAHYTAGDFKFGLGAGPGVSPAAGTAAFRGLLSLEWAPGIPAAAPSDRDGDGIPDTEDACPDVKGVRTDDPRTNGCPSDRDRDGIPDTEDACPDVPGIRTDDPKTNGCPSDRDRDGIPDTEDACPDVPGVRTDDPKTNGCPSDRDKDGVPDTEDACPDVPGVRTNDPKTNGCPPDRDHDGIPDALDACPDEPGPANRDPKKNGCPLAFVRDNQIQITEQVKFRFGLADLDPVSDTILAAVLQVMKAHTDIAKIRIEGHTDNKGTAELNKRLSEARAAAVLDWLVKHGIDRSHVSSRGFGFDRPIDTNNTDEGRANNRRVEFHIEGEGKPKP